MYRDRQYVTVKRTARTIHKVARNVKRLASATVGLEQCAAHLSLEARKEAFSDVKREMERVGEWLTWATKVINFLEVDGLEDYGILRPQEPSHPIY
jgi:hypothetical protein